MIRVICLQKKKKLTYDTDIKDKAHGLIIIYI